MSHFTADWFTVNADGWLRMVGHLRDRPATGLEIGSFEGRSACWLMENIFTHKDSVLSCVDSWDGQDPCLGERARDAEKMFDSNMSKFEEKFRKYKGKSRWQMPWFPDSIFDLVFIDGDHEGHSALTDLVLSWPLVKPGGMLVFDDYEWDGGGYGLRTLPKDAFDAWMSVKPPNMMSVEPVGRLMFVKKEQ